MSEENRQALIAEMERRIDELMESRDLSPERKAEILRHLLGVAIEEL